MADRSRSLIYNLYKAFTGTDYRQNNGNRQRGYDPRTGTFYCGKDENLPYYLNDDAKRYLASRYYDYKNKKVDDNGRLLTVEELEANKQRADAILGVMNVFGIPVSEFI